MADCSAAGTTIDRVARAVLGSGNQDATKHVGALFGHVAIVAGNQGVASMPLSAPEHLALPEQFSQSHAPLSENRTLIPSSHHHGHPTNFHPGVGMHPYSHMQYQQQQQQQHPMYMMGHPHQAMAQQAMLQHQQQQVMHHQMQMMIAQQQFQQLQQQQQQKQRIHPQVSETVSQEEVHDNLDKWHENLEEEFQRYAGENEEQETIGHEGVVRGASIEELAAAWAQAEAEYEQMAESHDVDVDHANLFQGGDSVQKFSQPYEFINRAEHSETTSNMNWMDEGMKQFRSGNLKEAIRSFEMELQLNNPDNATAWRMLGRCHAENDMDPEAIKCLEAAVDRDPYSPDSLLALGVSYVNELDHDRALETMKAWFTHNPKYAGMELPNDIYSAADSNPNRSAFEEVKQLLLAALAFDATDSSDVHEALGVIYNVIKDYDAAAESLRHALETRPNDYQLWNKLGATLANGSLSDQALPAYHRALQLKPKYARAWLNMAISHSNLQDHDEAARCYLQTLSLNPGAKHCWTYLRMALSSAERWDLLPLCFAQDLAAFREHFDFMYDN